MDSGKPEGKSKQEKFQSSANTSDENFVLNSNETTVTGTALNNSVILTVIFGYLSPADLRSCCNVNQTWLSIADPMIYDYQLIWTDLSQVKVKITTGFTDSQIETRISTIAAEMEFLQNQRRAVFVEMIFDASKMKDYNSSENLVIHCREFLNRVGSKVYKLVCVGDECARQFFSKEFNNEYATQKATIFHTRYFVYVEDLRLLPPELRQLVWPKISSWDDFPLLHVSKFYTGDSAYITTSEGTVFTILKPMPNVRELHGVPYTFVRELQESGKLPLLRSFGLNKRYTDSTCLQEDDAVKCIVEAKLKLLFMVIGRKMLFDREHAFVIRLKKNLEHLLEHGRETLEHLMIRALKPERIIQLPCEMPAVKHITFRGSRLFERTFFFKEGEDLLKIFPNVNTITFLDFPRSKWELTNSWWLPGGIFQSEEFRKKIRFMNSNQELERSVTEQLLERFYCVKLIDIITVYPYGDYTIADGIVST